MHGADLLRLSLLLGLPACVLLGALILLMVSRNPRLMLQDYPKDVQAAVPGKTPTERRQTLYWSVPFWLVFLGFPLAAALTVKMAQGSLLMIGVAAFSVGMLVNLFDWLVLDWLIFCTLTPAFVVIPGTAGFAGYKDYGMHFRGFLIGTVIFAAISAIIAAVVFLV